MSGEPSIISAGSYPSAASVPHQCMKHKQSSKYQPVYVQQPAAATTIINFCLTGSFVQKLLHTRPGLPRRTFGDHCSRIAQARCYSCG